MFSSRKARLIWLAAMLAVSPLPPLGWKTMAVSADSSSPRAAESLLPARAAWADWSISGTVRGRAGDAAFCRLERWCSPRGTRAATECVDDATGSLPCREATAAGAVLCTCVASRLEWGGGSGGGVAADGDGTCASAAVATAGRGTVGSAAGCPDGGCETAANRSGNGVGGGGSARPAAVWLGRARLRFGSCAGGLGWAWSGAADAACGAAPATRCAESGAAALRSDAANEEACGACAVPACRASGSPGGEPSRRIAVAISASLTLVGAPAR